MKNVTCMGRYVQGRFAELKRYLEVDAKAAIVFFYAMVYLTEKKLVYLWGVMSRFH